MPIRALRGKQYRFVMVMVMLSVFTMSTACAILGLLPEGTKPPEPPVVSTSISEPDPKPLPGIPDVQALREQMLVLINEDRADAGLPPVQSDAFAQQVAQGHAADMATLNYMSHWNLAGFGPDIRYGLAGGVEYVSENLHSYWYRYDDGTPAPISDWDERIIEAQHGFMDSPGHRDTILTPEHTHVGIGIAYNPVVGELRIAQEFIMRYAECSVTRTGNGVPESYTFEGTLYDSVVDPLINLAYEPFPEPLSKVDAEARIMYTSPAENYDAFRPTQNGAQLSSSFTLPEDRQPGFHHLRLWVDVDGEQIPTCDVLVVVQD